MFENEKRIDARRVLNIMRIEHSEFANFKNTFVECVHYAVIEFDFMLVNVCMNANYMTINRIGKKEINIKGSF